MKFDIRNEYLNNIINKIHNGLSNRNVIDALNGIKINCFSDRIEFITSRQDLSILYTLTNDFKVYEEGEVIIPSKFLSALNKDGDGNITTIESNTKAGTAKIKSQYSEITALTYSLSSYPNINFKQPEGNCIELSTKTFKNIYKETNHAAAMIKEHQCFMGINFEFSNGKLIASATDARRLSIVKHNLELNYNANFTINKELVKIICSLITDEKTMKIYHTNKQLLILFGDYAIKCALIDEEYPDLSRLVLKDENIKYKFKVNKNYLLPILEKIEELNKNVINPNLTIAFEGEQGTITSEFQDFGSLKEKFSSTDLEGKPINITLEPKFFKQALNAFDSDIVSISVENEISPILISNVDNKNNIQEISPIKR